MFHGAFSSYSTNDLEAMKEFYGTVLGLTLEEYMGGVRFTVGNQQTFIYPKDDHKPATFTVLNFVVDDIDAAIDELVGKGITFEHYDNPPAPQDEKGVLRGKAGGMESDIAWFEDPSGNILALVE